MSIKLSKKYLSVPDLSFKKALHEVGRNAFVDWLCVLGFSSVIALALIAAGIYLHVEVANGDFQSPDSSQLVTPATFDAQALSKLIQQYNAKADLTTQAEGGYTGVPDPTL